MNRGQSIKILAANWKMHGSSVLVKEFVTHVVKKAAGWNGVHGIVCPPFVYLPLFSSELNEQPWALGAQNVYIHDSGPYTGEISPIMLTEYHCQYALVGHSERRTCFGETDELLAAKLKALFAHQITPILCIGETAEQRDAGKTAEVLTQQLNATLSAWAQASTKASGAAKASVGEASRSAVAASDASTGAAGRSAIMEADTIADSLIIAYEPIWAIGTGRTATVEQVQESHALIKAHLTAMCSAWSMIPVIYGGSVKAANAAELLTAPDNDGFLVGGASLDVEQFIKIGELCNNS